MTSVDEAMHDTDRDLLPEGLGDRLPAQADRPSAAARESRRAVKSSIWLVSLSSSGASRRRMPMLAFMRGSLAYSPHM